MLPLLLTLAVPRDYVAIEAKWRTERDAAMRREGGWPSVAGLFWLDEGIATIGSRPGSTVQLTGVPSDVGTAVLRDRKVFLQAEPSARVTVNGRPASGGELKSDAKDSPDRIKVGRLTLTVIERGERIGFRVVDPEAPRRKAFRGLRWFPVDPSYRIVARFVPYPTPKTIPIMNVLGDVRQAKFPGYATFRLRSKTVKMMGEDTGDGLFFNFRDLTSARETYGAGRFLDAPKPKNGQVILDFNRATNPPCAFTDFATCPLPPRGNFLNVAIRAGALNGHPEP